MRKLSISPLVCVLGDAVARPDSAMYHFPGAELLSDGSIYLCARRDRGMNDPYGANEAVLYLPSTGELRPMPSPSAQDLRADGGRTAYSCYVSELAPNELIAVYGLLQPEGRSTLFDEETYGMCDCRLRIARSHDNGLSWDAAEDLAYQTPDIMVPSRIIKTKNGIVGFHVEMHNHWESAYHEPVQARFIYSTDGGRSFENAGIIPHDADFLAGDARTTLDERGNLCSFFWGFDLKAMRDLAVFRSFSSDGGRTFSRVEPVRLNKQITSPFCVDRDNWFCIYQERFSEKPGLYAAWSTDGGLTWDEDNAVGIFVSGRAPRSANAFDSGNDEAYTFGYSTLTKLAANRALATFWHTNGGGTCISVCEITSSR